jgi:putative tryptophan/tyrosine transport system ATP-binding protein
MALLSLQQIHKTFEKGTVNENHVLRGLDLDIEQGDFISVIGGNGAGKSTLMNSIAGVLSIDEGDILLEGQWRPHKWPKLASYSYFVFLQ